LILHLPALLEMAIEGFGDRVAVGPRGAGVTYARLGDLARRAAVLTHRRGVERIGVVDVNSEVVPVLLYGSGLAGVPFVPVNYRLDDEHLRTIAASTAPSLLVVEDSVVPRLSRLDGVEVVTRAAFLAGLDAVDAGSAPATIADPDDAAVLLFTSGTTGEPKAAVLRHRHLVAYVLDTVEFMGAGEDEAALVSVPPYHVAGISASLTSVFAGRRLVYLPAFSPEAWVATAHREAVTQAMVVPTMLARLVDVIVERDERLACLRHLAYGGGRMPAPVIERALTLLPHVEFVQAYGLTETSSTIAVLGPEDHRTAMASSDPSVRRRLGSVGRPIPTLELEIRAEDGTPVGPNQVGEIFVRGEQVAGEYVEGAGLADDGWFATRDAGYRDDDGYLYLSGRLDDVIVRGAENISPGEIEDVLGAHPAVAEAAVVGLPDVEWGERVAAVVVLAAGASASEVELQDWVRSRLRSSKTPGRIEFRAQLPYTETGKLLRRVLKAELTEG
jgi:acyl-CoA synthetase (AMP-forming)/AMP-acid ligase II